MKLDFQKFNESDADIYLEGEMDAFTSTYPGITITETIKKELKYYVQQLVVSSNRQAFTAFKDKEAIGFIIIARQIHIDMEVGYIENIYVKKDQRRSGVGGRLLGFAEKYCANNNLKLLQLDVSIHHDAARALYEKEGFTISGFKMEKTIIS